jgi:spore germination protein PA
MPAIVGAVKVNNISSSGVFNIGDVFNIAPTASTKAFAGAGSFNTGDFIKNINYHSVTQTYDTEVTDASNMSNIA